MLLILTSLWIVSALVSIVTWTRTALRGRGWIETQKKRGENGVLRLIAVQKFHLATVACAISALMLLVVLTVLLPQPERALMGRAVLLLIAMLFAYMGWQFDHQSHRIMDKVRAEVINAKVVEDVREAADG